MDENIHQYLKEKLDIQIRKRVVATRKRRKHEKV